MSDSTRSRILEVMARAAKAVLGEMLDAKPLPPPVNNSDDWGAAGSGQSIDLIEAADKFLAHLSAEGMAVVPKDRMVDFFAEIDAAIVSVQGALRHYKQPQDVHFHLALKACRDGTAMLTSSPYGKASMQEASAERAARSEQIPPGKEESK